MGSDLNVVRIKTVQNLIYFALRTDKCHDLWLFSSLFPLYIRFYNSFIDLLALLYSFQLYFIGSDPDIFLALTGYPLIHTDSYIYLMIICSDQLYSQVLTQVPAENSYYTFFRKLLEYVHSFYRYFIVSDPTCPCCVRVRAIYH